MTVAAKRPSAPVAPGTSDKSAPKVTSAGTISHRVFAGFTSGEKAVSWTTSITSMRPANISPNSVDVIAISRLRKVRPTSGRLCAAR